MSVTRVRPAADAEIDTILGWTHALWGARAALPAYVARTRGYLATPWGRERYRFMVAHDAAGTPVAACKAYRLAAELAGEPVEALGFGAVFTRPECRGQGHAGRMLRSLMEEAGAGGTAIALLFSDIGPALYADLGFTALDVSQGQAPALAGPAPFAPWPADRPIPGAWRLASPFRIARTPDYWDYALKRGEGAPLAWLPDGPDAPPRGFAVAEVEDDELWIAEAGLAPGDDATSLWSDLRRLAALRGVARAAGWLPDAAAAAGFTLAPLTKPLPMAAPLAGQAPPARSHLWSIDHF